MILFQNIIETKNMNFLIIVFSFILLGGCDKVDLSSNPSYSPMIDREFEAQKDMYIWTFDDDKKTRIIGSPWWLIDDQLLSSPAQEKLVGYKSRMGRLTIDGIVKAGTVIKITKIIKTIGSSNPTPTYYGTKEGGTGEFLLMDMALRNTQQNPADPQRPIFKDCWREIRRQP